MSLNFYLIFLFVIFFAIINCEKYILDNYQLSSNSVSNFKRFIYTKYTFHNATLERSGFSYNISLINTNNFTEGETFHIYIIKSDVIPHFDLLNNPAICCSPQGGKICDETFEANNKNNPKAKEESFKQLKTHSVYTKDLNLSRSADISDKSYIEEEGIFYSLFLVCSPVAVKNSLAFEDYSKTVSLSGVFSFFNSFGYLSAEEFYTVDIYLFLCLYYFILSLYWVYKLIVNHSLMTLYSKLLSIILPIVILEKMMNLQIYSELNKEGDLNIAFEVISIVCNVLKNVIIRIILFGICLGYKYTISDFKQISNKKIFNFALLMIGYVTSLIVYSIIYSRYIFYESSLAYLILSFFFLHLTNLYILWKIYKGLVKQLVFSINHKMTAITKFYEIVIKILKICAAIVIISTILQGSSKLFSNHDFIWKSKWLLDILIEIVFLIIFSTFIILLLKSHYIENREGYVYQLEESNFDSTQSHHHTKIENI